MKLLKNSAFLLLATTAFACDGGDEESETSAPLAPVVVTPVAPVGQEMPGTGTSTTPDTTAPAEDLTAGEEAPEMDAAPASSGPTYLGQAAAGLTTLGVSVSKDSGGSEVTMSAGENPGEVCFKGSTPAVTDWSTQWGFSASFDLAYADTYYDGSAASSIDFSVSGTAPTLQVGLSDSVNKAPNGSDLLTFWAPASTGMNSVQIDTLAQPSWTISDETPEVDLVKGGASGGLLAIQITIGADVAAKSFDFCITDPVIDGYVAPEAPEAEEAP